MRRLGFVFLIAVAAGCGPQMTPGTGGPPVVECHDLAGCPTDDQLLEMTHLVADIVPGFDPRAYFLLGWHADDEYFYSFEDANGETKRAVGYSPAVDEVHCNGPRTAGHEMLHVHAYRGDDPAYGDPNHALPFWKLEGRVKDAFSAYALEAGF